MKYLNAFLFILGLNIISNTLIAQNSNAKRYAFQVDYGISKTLHYNQPVDLMLCFEGCVAEEQKSRIASSLDLSVYRLLNQKNSLKIGAGFSEYRFWEKGLASPGAGTPLPFETIQALKYVNFNIGFRHVFHPQHKICPFVETEFLYEIYTEDSYFLKNSGTANKSKIGTIIKISDNWSAVVEGFYKTGIVKYNERKFNKNYIPYGYGIQLGINLRI